MPTCAMSSPSGFRVPLGVHVTPPGLTPGPQGSSQWRDRVGFSPTSGRRRVRRGTYTPRRRSCRHEHAPRAVIAAAPTAGQHRGVAPGPDDEPDPIDESTSATRLAGGMRAGDRRLARPGAGCPRARRPASDCRRRRHRHWRRGGARRPASRSRPLLARPGPGWTQIASTERRAVIIASPPVVRALVVHAVGRLGVVVLAPRRRRPRR